MLVTMQVQELMKKIQDLEGVLFISKEGKLLDYDISDRFLKEHDFKTTKHLTNLVGLRFRINDFAELFGGLEMTINRFKNKIMVSKSLKDDRIMVLILPLKVDLEEINQILQYY